VREDGAIRMDGPATTFHRAELSTTATLRSGMIRMVGMGRPTGTPELDGSDVLQAVFVRADVVPALPREGE